MNPSKLKKCYEKSHSQFIEKDFIFYFSKQLLELREDNTQKID